MLRVDPFPAPHHITCLVACLVALVVLLGAAAPRAYGADAPTVAIADLDNHTGDTTLDGAGAGIAAVLISKFARVDAVQVVERARL